MKVYSSVCAEFPRGRLAVLVTAVSFNKPVGWMAPIGTFFLCFWVWWISGEWIFLQTCFGMQIAVCSCIQVVSSQETLGSCLPWKLPLNQVPLLLKSTPWFWTRSLWGLRFQQVSFREIGHAMQKYRVHETLWMSGFPFRVVGYGVSGGLHPVFCFQLRDKASFS